jgi:hypothetical protein
MFEEWYLDAVAGVPDGPLSNAITWSRCLPLNPPAAADTVRVAGGLETGGPEAD